MSGSSPVGYANAQLAKFSQPITSYNSISTSLPNVASLKGKTVYYVPIGLKVPYFQILSANMTAAFKSVGVKLVSCDGQFTPSGVSSCLAQAGNARANAVVLGAVPYQMVPTPIATLEADKIPVYLDSAAAPPGHSDSSLIQFGNSGYMLTPSAQLSADAVIADSNGKAKVLYIKIIDSPSLAAMGDAAIAEFKAHCPGCSVTTKTLNTANLTQLPSIVSGALLSNTGINYVVPQTDALLAGATTGIQNARATSRVKISTTSGTLAGLQQIDSGNSVIADVGFSAAYLAWADADSTLRLMLHQSVPASYLPVVRVFDKKNVSGLALTPAAQATNAWYGSNGYIMAFQKRWGVG